jgi:KDO2-lipid IV(A) lauroyltransferase
VNREKNITWVDRLLRGLAWLLNHLPRRWAVACGRALGILLYYIYPYRKDVARSNLLQAFPDYCPKRRQAILRRTYQHFGIMLIDFFRTPLLTRDNLSLVIEMEEDQLLEAMRNGKGALIMSAHIGNWELIVPALIKNGYPLVTVMVPQRGPGGSFIRSIRDSSDSQWISKKSSTRTMLRLLKEGKYLGLAGDQDSRKSGVWVSFFGQQSSRPRGGAVFALQSGAPMLAGWCLLQDDHRYQLKFTPIPTDNLPPGKEAAIQEITQRYITSVEEVIRQYPEQYFWFHRMWKTKPKKK